MKSKLTAVVAGASLIASGVASAALAAPRDGAAQPPASGRGAAGFTIEETTVDEIHKAFDDGSLSCKALVDGYLQRIEAYEGQLNAFVTVNPDAMAVARARDAQYRRSHGEVGPLHCVPVILKDNIETADMPTTGGSLALAGDVPAQDAFVTERLREAGAIIIGKGNLDEWAHGGRAGYSSVNGQTVNPYDPALSTGGSSGGPATAVAANFGVLGIGTDTLGSIRSPANQNSLVAVKPTRGLVSGTGVIPFALTFDVAGPMTRTVADSAQMINVLAGVDPEDPRTLAANGRIPSDYTSFLSTDALKGVRVGVLRTYVSGDDTALIDQAVADMKARGAEIVDGIQAPASMQQLQGKYYTFISETEFRTQLGEYLRTRRPHAPVQSHADVLAASEQPGFPIAEAVLNRLRSESSRGSMTDPAYLEAAQAGPAAMRQEIDRLLEEYDVDVLVHSAGSGSALASLAGYPAVVVPMGTVAAGAPKGLAFLGKAFTEGPMLGYAYAFEQATRHRVTPRYTPPLDFRPPLGTSPGLER
jgi:amidase